MALNNLEDRLECAISHINTSVDIDPWAQSLAVESMRMRIALMKGEQPEIIRCKDCKHFIKHRDEKSAKKFGQEYECECGRLNVPEPDDFCSRPKRKENR